MSAEQTIILITGANGGIGFELAAHLIQDSSKHVLLGSRSFEKGEKAVLDLQSRKPPGTVELLLLDVADEESISTAAKQIESKHGRLDALVNNAAIGCPSGSLGEAMAQLFRTNAIGPYLMVEAFASLLKKSITTPRIINVTSGAGSVPRRLDPNGPGYNMGMKGVGYGASKAAMNLITATQAVRYEEDGFKVFAFSPGFVVSGLGPQNTAANGAQETAVGAAPMVKILNGERDGDHPRNGFLRAQGQSPW